MQTHTRDFATMSLLAFASVVALTGCASQLPGDDTSLLASSSASTSTLYVSVPLSSLSTGASMQLTATGGTAPYDYSMSGASDSTVNSSTGVFVAGATAGSYVVNVVDAAGGTGFGTVTVISSSSGSTTSTTTAFTAGNLIMTAGTSKTLGDGSHLSLQNDGNLVFYNSANTAVYSSNTAGMNCASGCIANFAAGGNFSLSVNGIVYWNSATNGATLTISESAPYVQIADGSGNVQWSSNNTSGILSSITFTPGTFKLYGNDRIWVNGGYLNFQGDGNLVMANSSGSALYNTGTTGYSCGTNCEVDFQGDGNLVLYSNGVPYFNTATSGAGAYFVVSNSYPYMQVISAAGAVLWYSH